MRLKLLAAVPAGDQAAEQVGPVPWPAHAEASGLPLGLRGIPELLRDDRGERALDDDVLRHGALDLAASFADLRVAGFGVDERAAVDRVVEDRPDGALGPSWAPLAA